MAQLYYSSLESKMKSYLDEQKALEKIQEEQLQALRMTNQINSLAAQQQLMREQAISNVIEKVQEKEQEQKKTRARSKRNDIPYDKNPVSFEKTKEFMEKYYPMAYDDVDDLMTYFYSSLVKTQGFKRVPVDDRPEALVDSGIAQGEMNNFIIARLKNQFEAQKRKKKIEEAS